MSTKLLNRSQFNLYSRVGRVCVRNRLQVVLKPRDHVRSDANAFCRPVCRVRRVIYSISSQPFLRARKTILRLGPTWFIVRGWKKANEKNNVLVAQLARGERRLAPTFFDWVHVRGPARTDGAGWCFPPSSDDLRTRQLTRRPVFRFERRRHTSRSP